VHENAFQLLIATILSAQTTDRSVNLVTPELFRRHPSPADLGAANPAEIEKLIKPTGFFRAKTVRIIAASRKLVELFGGEVPKTMEELIQIPGIGRKTANVILGAGFGVPGFAVDTHVIRLSNRIGLVKTKDPVKIEFQVCAMVPKEEWTALSLRLILHGRRVCIARLPRCEVCPLNDFCPSSLVPRGRAAPVRCLLSRAHPPPGRCPPPACQPDGHRSGNAVRPQPRRVRIERLFYHGSVPPPDPRRIDVEYLEVDCKSALNPVKNMGFSWSLNPYTGCEHRCAFCYVRAFELRADRPSDDRYGRTIRVKVNVAGVLRSELQRRSWHKEMVVIGAATDPYQPAEGRYRLTRQCLEVMRDLANPASIITRGPMIVRDIDVLSQLARRAELHITFSIPTVDDEIWRKTEPGTAHPRHRLRAIERLAGAGVDVGVGMAPILPGLSDRPEQLERVVKAARAAGATGIWAGMLHLKEGTRQHFMSVLSKHWPDLVPRYEHDYWRRAYLPPAAGAGTMQEVARLRSRYAVANHSRVILKPPPAPEQLTLLH
jgi:endonuclease III